MTPDKLDRLPAEPVARLRAIVALLRSPEGCPWDREQTHESLRAGLLEEACETIDAITRADDANLREELGDLLLQVVFHADLAAERGAFTLEDAARHTCEKLIRRHPHVFADGDAADTGAVLRQWEQIKRQEKGGHVSIMDGIPRALPALIRAANIQKKASRVGFDWPDTAGVIDKFREELAELCVELEAGDQKKLEHELGDLLFTAVNMARKLGVEPELALEHANQRFIARFQHMESSAAAGHQKLDDLTPEGLDTLWREAKSSL
ncbi:MAG: nucleoside triphosphate pyrophosphohydrolase [Chthoniobacterales bacterium]|jgi:MazG family protein|nr:nucleoside triphosphate pyrophosphohydrolase [Chthoniobacterales bacterium]